MVFPRYQCALQIRGCFLHKHGCHKSNTPKSNTQYWTEKLARNQRRDEQNDLLLKQAGWLVIVVWECEIASRQKFEAILDQTYAMIVRPR